MVQTEASGPSELALAPLPLDYRDALDLALAQRADIEALVARVVDAGLRRIYLSGCGGSLTTFGPLQYQLERRTAQVPVLTVTAAELVHRDPPGLRSGSLVLLASGSGSTPEAVAAAAHARARGATVIAFTRSAESPLAQVSNDAFAFGPERGISDPKYIAFGLLGLALLRRLGDMPADEHAAHVRALEALPDALLAACRETEAANSAIARDMKDEPIVYVLGSGPNHAAAYNLAMCCLQEMQWMNAVSFSTTELFHGALEVITNEVPVIQLLGEEGTRPIDDRAKAFLGRFTSKAHFLDTRELTMPGIEPSMRPYASSFALTAVIQRLVRHFEAARGHSIELRRYMSKVEY